MKIVALPPEVVTATAVPMSTTAHGIKMMMDEDRWQEGRSPFGLPKTKVVKVVIKKAKKAKEEEKPAEGEAAAAAAAPAE